MIGQVHQRRGITLLFVISLIVLFLLMGAAFVTMSGNFMRVSRGNSKLEVRGDSARTVIDRALMDLLRGTTSTTSVLNDSVFGDQSILGDMYGPGIEATVNSASSIASGQLIGLTITPTIPGALSNVIGAYGGHVLTFISDPPPPAPSMIKGMSCRIFHYDPTLSPQVIIVPEWTNGLNPFANLPALTNAKVWINGQPFAGASTVPSEPYDAIDPANAFLAGVDFASINPPLVVNPIIYPSFFHFSSGAYDDFRAFTSTSGPVVDNDSDGQNDSIWVDIGLPTQTDKSGRQYKPLVAYMVLDLDGRYNLNVHGTENDARGREVFPDGDRGDDGNNFADVSLIGNPNLVPRGQGYGPSEISMHGLFPLPDPAMPASPPPPSGLGNFNPEHFNILGDPSSPFFGRLGPFGPLTYGAGEPEVHDPWSAYKLFGYPSDGVSQLFGSRMDTMGYYGWGFRQFPGSTKNYDARGLLPIQMPGVDAVPAFNDNFLNSYLSDDLIDIPFETDFAGYPSAGPSENPLVAGGSIRLDHLFSLKELERVYRKFDMDSKFLSSRLLELATTLDSTKSGSDGIDNNGNLQLDGADFDENDPTKRLRIATESSEVPVPPKNMAVELGNLGLPNSDIASMLSPDILQGLKMDINRPFGNGEDNDGDFSIDEYYVGGSPNDDPNPTLDISRNGLANADSPAAARSEFAKHLYILARISFALAGPTAGNFDTDIEGGVIADLDDQQALAQWCINVVDFRDPDAIMTLFEFDSNPLNGWNVDGNPATIEWDPGPDSQWGIAGIDDDGNLFTDDISEAGWPASDDVRASYTVWGCERPELLITETLATHDRRTEDTAEGGTFAGGDILHSDNRLRPEASAFIELYAPWVSGDPDPTLDFAVNDITYPRELYQGNAVDLSRTHDGTLNGDPVWRIVIAGPDANGSEYVNEPLPTPAHPISADNRNRDPDADIGSATIDRVVYFIPSPGAALPGSLTAEEFFATTSGPLLLPVGEFAVLGSSGNVVGANTTTFGRRILDALGAPVVEGDPAVIADTRSITLDTVNGLVRIRDFHISNGNMIELTRSALVIPVEFPVTNPLGLPLPLPPRPFNVSDPTGGYPLVDADLVTPVPAIPTVDGWIYSTPYDVPLDLAGKIPSGYEFGSIRDDKTTPTYRVAHLQRLANPLAPWNLLTNPYRTVDSLSMNLTAFNGISSVPDQSTNGPSVSSFETVRDFAAMERGRNRKYPPSDDYVPIGADINEHRNLWSQDGLSNTAIRRGNLFRIDPGINEIKRAGDPGWHLSHEPATVLADPDQHIFNSTVFETLGAFNDAWFDHWQGDQGIPAPSPPSPLWLEDDNTPTNQPSRYANFVPPPLPPLPLPPTPIGLDEFKPFTWFTWNNRPYVSQYELMLVPMKSSSQLLATYSAKANSNPYESSGPGFAHLPNFFLGTFMGHSIDFFKLLDFVEVPSRYVGTERYFDSSTFPVGQPFNKISRFRYPGKVNINTVFDPTLWNGIMREYAVEFPYAAMDSSRRTGTEFTFPFGNPALGVNGGLLRETNPSNVFPLDPMVPPTPTDPLLVYDPSVQLDCINSNRNAYFRYDPIQRMGNLVTTRSSVFAIWITVGYFEVDPATGDLMANAQELGADSGQITRHRGFFIFDRSIPVAFEKGVDHNIERGILVQSYIE